MASRELNDLDYRVKNKMMELLARASEAGIPLMIINTLRTPEEQAEYVAKGTSWTNNSRHLPQQPDGKSLAMDVCPYDQFQLHGPDKLNWNDADPVWKTLGKIGQGLGLKWGVVDSAGNRKDLGHFEYWALADRIKI